MRNIICRLFGHDINELLVLMAQIEVDPINAGVDLPDKGIVKCRRCGARFKAKPQRPDLTSGCVINTMGDGWIQCLDCKRKSYHPKDIEHRYCGCCHKFHPPVSVEK